MLDGKRIALAKAKGIGFLCRMCVHWYEGEDRGLQDEAGREQCSSTICGSPVSGKDFPDYKGPLGNQLTLYCFLCGKEGPQQALRPKVAGGRQIGCCDKCLKIVEQRVAAGSGIRVMVYHEDYSPRQKFDEERGQ
jgi:hypothetical protein